MKVAISVDDKQDSAPVSEVFGRCKFFALYDISSKKLTYIENPGVSQQRGAGILAAQTLIDNKVEKVYCGNIGPNAENALTDGNIKVDIVTDKTVKDLITAFKK